MADLLDHPGLGSWATRPRAPQRDGTGHADKSWADARVKRRHTHADARRPGYRATFIVLLAGAIAALVFSDQVVAAVWGRPGFPGTPWLPSWPSSQQLSCSAAVFTGFLRGHPEASVESVVPVAEGGSYGEGAANLPYPISPTSLPQLCAVIVKVVSSPSSSYRFGLFLPAISKWNGKFLTVGNGGFAGGINWLDMGSGPHYGFATMSSDLGHNSVVTDVSWAYNAPEKRTDWGWRALHGSVVLGKKLSEAYYGRRPRYSYYNGCSTGGRQGLKEIQEFPDSFDGAIIGAPAWQTSHSNNFVTKLGIYNLPVGAPNYIPPSLFPVLGAEVIRQCDEIDGVVDGIVSTLDECVFDFSKIQCGNPGVNASACLTNEQIQTAKNIYSDYYAENGTFLASSYSLSSELQWTVEMGGSEPSPFGVGYQRYFLLNDPNWDWHNFNDSLIDLADRTDPGNPTAAKYDISPFKKRGGKVFMYHGIADAIVTPRSTGVYYNRTIDVFGSLKQTVDFFRFFLVPGMQHCYSTVTDSPWAFAGAGSPGVLGNDTWSVPGFKDKRHDALMALMDWVENRKPIDSIIATTWRSRFDPSSGVLRQRPLCPWPQKAVYNKVGDVNAASSWRCE